MALDEGSEFSEFLVEDQNYPPVCDPELIVNMCQPIKIERRSRLDELSQASLAVAIHGLTGVLARAGNLYRSIKQAHKS